MCDNDMFKAGPVMNESPSGSTRGRASDPHLDRRREALADGVRYRVLGRLAAGLRHAMLGQLQVIQGLADATSRMLGANPNPAAAAERLGRIAQQCGGVVRSYDATVEWFRPDPYATATARDCIDRCIHLAEAEWILCGTSATTRSAKGADVQVHKAPFEQLMVTALLVAADSQLAPAQIIVEASVQGAHVSVSIRTTPAVGSAALERSSRTMTRDDLQDLAWSHAVAIACASDEIRMQFPITEAGGSASRVGP